MATVMTMKIMARTLGPILRPAGFAVIKVLLPVGKAFIVIYSIFLAVQSGYLETGGDFLIKVIPGGA
jgi:hypothetical protein